MENLSSSWTCEAIQSKISSVLKVKTEEKKKQNIKIDANLTFLNAYLLFIEHWAFE